MPYSTNALFLIGTFSGVFIKWLYLLQEMDNILCTARESEGEV
jgi:hypothetical protein